MSETHAEDEVAPVTQRGDGMPGRAIGLPGPTALRSGPGSHQAAGPPPRKAPLAKVAAYVVTLGLLVGVSLYLRSSHRQAATATPGTSPAAGAAGAQSAAIQPVADNAWTKQACKGQVPSGGFHLLAAFESTAGTVALWEDGLAQGSALSPLHALETGTAVAVCYIDGPWQVPAEAQQLYQSMGVSADRAIVVLVKGSSQPVGVPVIAPHQSLELVRPFVPAGVTATATP